MSPLPEPDHTEHIIYARAVARVLQVNSTQKSATMFRIRAQAHDWYRVTLIVAASYIVAIAICG